MRKEEFAKLQVGDIVSGQLTGQGYVIMARCGDSFIGVRAISIRNPVEWTLVFKSRAVATSPPPYPTSAADAIRAQFGFDPWSE